MATAYRLILLTIVAICIAQPASAQPAARPNIIFILCDDLGYADLSCYGAPKIKTPHLDAMAAQGVRFTSFYATNGVCTPTRASLMTGCYPKRIGMHKAVLPPRSNSGLHPNEVTIARLLRGQGYATACVGKWHLGEAKQTLPTAHGFDSYFGMAGPNHGASDLYQGSEVIEEKGKIDLPQTTQRYTARAIEFLRQSKDKPFFLYLAHGAPHVPLTVSPDFKGKSAAGLYGDVIQEIDWSVGQVLQALKELKLDDRTLVIFTSDNGQAGVAAQPFHGGKGSTWEAGHRVPCLVRWPEKVAAGGVCREVAIMFDWMPTLASLAGAALPADRKIDGTNIWPLVTQPGAKSPHEFFVYYSRESHASAIRSGKWKLHVVAPVEKWAGKLPPEALLNTKPTEALPWLYDLEADIGETKNVAKDHPEIVARLQKQLEDTDQTLAREARPIFETPK